MKDGTIIQFKPYRKGLYTYDGHIGEDNKPAWAFINTIADHKEEYTKQEYRDAMQAWKRQNILMFPSIWKMTKITDGATCTTAPLPMETFKLQNISLVQLC